MFRRAPKMVGLLARPTGSEPHHISVREYGATFRHVAAVSEKGSISGTDHKQMSLRHLHVQSASATQLGSVGNSLTVPLLAQTAVGRRCVRAGKRSARSGRLGGPGHLLVGRSDGLHTRVSARFETASAVLRQCISTHLHPARSALSLLIAL